jgi:chemotaxis protein MotA
MKINFTAFFGIGIAAAIVYFGVIHSAKNPVMFLDSHALILVLGGTVAAALIAFPAGKLYSLLDFLVLGMLFPSKKEMIKVADELLYLNNLFKLDPQSLKNAKYSHAFVREVVGLLTESNLSEVEFKNVLTLRSKNILKSYQADSKILNALAKFPPAFGLLGATTGMIEMMSNLGKGGGASSIGSAMAVALVATFWGIAIANFILLPLADRAGKMAVDDAHIRDMIIEAAMVIKNKGSEYLLLNTLRGFLPLTQRNSVSVYNNYAQSPYVPGLQVVKTPAEKAADAAMEKWSSKVKTHKPQKMNLEPPQPPAPIQDEVLGEREEQDEYQAMENTIPPDSSIDPVVKNIDFSHLRPKPNEKLDNKSKDKLRFFKKTK